MTGVALTRADIALFSDPASTLLVIPRLQVMQRTRQPEQTLVRFEGDVSPTLFRGEGLEVSYPLTARYLEDEHADAYALLALFETAHLDAADGRLQLRAHAGAVGGLNPFEVIAVSDITEGAGAAGDGVWDISFTATRLTYTIEV